MIDDLSRYRWHTGARLRRVAPDELIPPLFRDVGVAPLVRFLDGQLTRLAGPMTPLTYLRTAAYVEPYVDHGGTGRLVSLDGRALGVWHSGVRHIYVAASTRWSDALLYAPGEVSRAETARLLNGATTVAEGREALGGRQYLERCEYEHDKLRRLAASEARAEAWLAPLREALQRGEQEAQRHMERLGISEADLCATWHHLPVARRAHLCALSRTEGP